MRKGLALAMVVEKVAILALAAKTAAGRAPLLAQRRTKVIQAARCARATKVRAVRGRDRSNAPMSTSMSAAGAATEIVQIGAPGWTSMSIAGTAPEDGTSMSAWGDMGIAAV
jgi:hypothetical protein